MIDSPDKIKVTSRIAAPAIRDSNVAAVSFFQAVDGDKWKAHYPSNVKHVLYIDAADLDGSKPSHVNAAEVKHLHIFDENDAKKLVEFVNEVRPDVDVLYFQCEAGVSRSAASAMATQKAWFNKENISNNPLYSPNMWIYNLILKEFRK